MEYIIIQSTSLFVMLKYPEVMSSTKREQWKILSFCDVQSFYRHTSRARHSCAHDRAAGRFTHAHACASGKNYFSPAWPARLDPLSHKMNGL